MTDLSKQQAFQHFAKRYVWWGDLHWALNHPRILLANVMNFGCWEDVQHIQELVSKDTLRQVLKEAPPGIFTERSWHYWHHKLGVLPVPHRPKRELS